MAYNGTGGWNRLFNWTNDAANGIKIRCDRMDAETNDMANNGLGAVLTRDGQGSAGADQPMNTFKHLNVGNAVARNSYAAAGQVQDSAFNHSVAAGTADALTAAMTPTLPALVDGQVFRIKAATANATTTPTLIIDAIGSPIVITKFGGHALVAGDIIGAGHELEIVYSSATPTFELLNPGSAHGLASGATISDATISGSTLLGATCDTISGGAFEALAGPANTIYNTGIAASGQFNVVSGGSQGVALEAGGTSWVSLSDERTKTALTPFEDALGKLLKLRAGTGRYLTDAETVRRSFLIAQDVEKVLPEAVTRGEDGLLKLSYTDVIPLLVAALQEAFSRIDDLEAIVVP